MFVIQLHNCYCKLGNYVLQEIAAINGSRSGFWKINIWFKQNLEQLVLAVAWIFVGGAIQMIHMFFKYYEKYNVVI